MPVLRVLLFYMYRSTDALLNPLYGWILLISHNVLLPTIQDNVISQDI